MRKWVAVGLAVLGLGLGLTVAGEAEAATATFDGSCEFTAVQIRLNDALGPQEGTYSGTMAGPGTCTGTINGRHIDKRVSKLGLQMSGRGSCQSATVYSGSGTFTVDGVALPVSAALIRPNPTIQLIFELRGTASGFARGEGKGDPSSALSPGDPAHGSLGCLDPNGDSTATGVDVPFATQSPLVSTVPDPSVARLGLRATDQRTATVLRTGAVRTRCIVPVAGRCSVRVVRGGKTLARGSAEGVTGRSVVVRARLTRAGRRALRRGGPLRAQVRATAGAATRNRTIVLR